MKKLIISLLVCAVGTASTASANPSPLKKLLKELKIEQVITQKEKELQNSKLFRVTEKAEVEIRKLIRKEATVELKKSEVIDVFEQVKKEFMIEKRLLVAQVQVRDMQMIQRVTAEYCKTVPRTPVPDGGFTLALLGIGLLGLVGAQRWMRRT